MKTEIREHLQKSASPWKCVAPQGQNSRHQVWREASLLAEPSHQTTLWLFKRLRVLIRAYASGPYTEAHWQKAILRHLTNPNPQEMVAIRSHLLRWHRRSQRGKTQSLHEDALPRLLQTLGDGLHPSELREQEAGGILGAIGIPCEDKNILLSMLCWTVNLHPSGMKS